MAAYHEALMRRLGMIDELGTNATALMPQRATPQINLPAAEQYSGPVGASGGGGGKGFNSFMGAISAKESGNNYGARNRDSGAMGKYQIMPANIQGNRGWDYEALGRNISTSQFMASPQLQEAIAKYKLQQYYNKWVLLVLPLHGMLVREQRLSTSRTPVGTRGSKVIIQALRRMLTLF